MSYSYHEQDARLRRFYTLDLYVRRNMHPSNIHQWNPYRRNCFTPGLSTEFFNAQNFTKDGVHTTPDFAFMGCIDAPDEIPLGCAMRVTTVGGWEREEYWHRHREVDDWRAYARASAKTAEMLKKILAEAEASD